MPRHPATNSNKSVISCAVYSSIYNLFTVSPPSIFAYSYSTPPISTLKFHLSSHRTPPVFATVQPTNPGGSARGGVSHESQSVRPWPEFRPECLAERSGNTTRPTTGLFNVVECRGSIPGALMTVWCLWPLSVTRILYCRR
ncbi:hypothetical protein HOY82DRAFT_416938 [Tuber indicum]|nr:hypothetical protein HOY82DRAFT_416938 [Tuber indicum]